MTIECPRCVHSIVSLLPLPDNFFLKMEHISPPYRLMFEGDKRKEEINKGNSLSVPKESSGENIEYLEYKSNKDFQCIEETYR